jgi:hypothetical protein
MHFQFEVPVAWNLLWRGCEVRFFSCDGLFPICDIYRQAEAGDRPANACESCQQSVQSLFKEYGLPHDKLGKFKKTSDEIYKISKEIDKIIPAELTNYEDEGYQIYKWIISSFCTNLRVNGFDAHKELHVSTLKKYIVGGLLAARLIDRMLDAEKPDAIILFNGRQSYTRIAFELARRRGIRCICHERAELEERFSIWENTTCESFQNFQDSWRKWGPIPLNLREVLEVQNTIYRMSEGKGLNWKSFILPNKSSRLEDFLLTNKGKQVWALFPSSTDETAMNPVFWKAFKTQSEWISATLEFIHKNQNVALIIRAHPNMGSEVSGGKNQEEISYFKKIKETFSQNVLVIEPHEQIDSYEILPHVKIGLVFASTLSIEMACRGIPIVAVGNPGWSNCPMIASAENRSEYLDKLSRLCSFKPTGSDLLGLVKGAYRLAHAYYFKASIKFSFLKQLNYFSYSLDSRTAEDFKTGKHPELDRVVEIILGHEEVVPRPRRVPLRDDFDEEETAVGKALAFFRHPEFLTPFQQLSVILQSQAQLEASLTARQGSVFSNSHLVEFILCNFEASVIENFSSSLRATYKNCVITEVKLSIPRLAETLNEAIRQSSGIFIMAPAPSIAIDLDFIEKFLHSPRREEKTIFYGNLKYASSAGIFSVQPPPNITAQVLSRCNPLPSCAIFPRKIWEDNNGFRRGYCEDLYWDFWLASAISGTKFQYINGLAEVLSRAPDYTVPPPPSVVINSGSVFNLEEINIARAALGFAVIDSKFTQPFKNLLDSNFVELKRIKENGHKLTWPTKDLVQVVQPLLRMRCYELALFILEEILAREPGNPVVLKVYSDVLPLCGRKEEVPFIQAQIATGAKIPMPLTQKLPAPEREAKLDFFSSEEVANIKSLAEAFQKNPFEKEAGEALRNLRLGLAEHLLRAKQESLPELFERDYGVVFDLLSGCGTFGFGSLPKEKKITDAARSCFENLGGKTTDANILLIAMLFFTREEFANWPSADSVPDWLQRRFRIFLGENTMAPLIGTQKTEPQLPAPSKRESSAIRILFLTGSPRNYMAPPQLGGFQINAGPDWENAKDSAGRWVSFKTPVGCYPIKTVLSQIPTDQQPDILVCLVDASRRNIPTGLTTFCGPKVLFVADTHHMQSPLSFMIAYAASEPFDRIAFLYDRHHIPFFQAAGFKNLFWLPGFTFPHDGAALEKVTKPHRRNIVGFVGQAGKFHPRRARLLEALQAGKIPLIKKAVSQSESLKFYASAAVGFNASLNGDLNLRFFEILSSGATLLTDSLGLESGLEVLKDSGCRFETYSSGEELVEKAKNLLLNRNHAADIGNAGRSWFVENLNRAKRSEIFHRVAFDGFEPEIFKIPANHTFKISFSGNQLSRALEVYERVQELHRVQEKTTILRSELAGDLDFFKSLPRMEIDAVCAGKRGDLLVTTVAGEESARLDGVQCQQLWLVDGERPPGGPHTLGAVAGVDRRGSGPRNQAGLSAGPTV